MLEQKTGARASWWIRIVVIVGALLMGTGAVLSLVDPAMLVGRESQMNGAAQVFAGYFAARNLAMAGLLLVLAIMQAGRWKTAEMVARYTAKQGARQSAAMRIADRRVPF